MNSLKIVYFLVITKKIEGNLEYNDMSFCNVSISWYDMEFNEFFDTIGISNETNIISCQTKKDISIINVNETDLENLEMIEKLNNLKLVILSGHFGEFDRKKSKKNIEIVINIVGGKHSALDIMK